MSSSKLTKSKPPQPPMVESKALSLSFALAAAREAIVAHASKALRAKGHAAATPSTLHFIGQLDCGINQASEIARRLGVSRQMVSRTAAELAELGLLRIETDPETRNQKIIRFTTEGERLVAEARRALADLDRALARAAPANDLDRLLEALHRISHLGN